MSTLKQIVRDITSYIGDAELSDEQAERLRIVRALLVDAGNEDVEMPQVWNYLLDEDEDVEIVMMDQVDEWCGDLYEQD